jgi:hypothetical protein
VSRSPGWQRPRRRWAKATRTSSPPRPRGPACVGTTARGRATSPGPSLVSALTHSTPPCPTPEGSGWAWSERPWPEPLRACRVAICGKISTQGTGGRGSCPRAPFPLQRHSPHLKRRLEYPFDRRHDPPRERRIATGGRTRLAPSAAGSRTWRGACQLQVTSRGLRGGRLRNRRTS